MPKHLASGALISSLVWESILLVSIGAMLTIALVHFGSILTESCSDTLAFLQDSADLLSLGFRGKEKGKGKVLQNNRL